MAKRRKLEAPSAEDLSQIEAELTQAPGLRAAAPIAQVAADSAGAFDPRPAVTRAADARDKVDAAALRDAQTKGLVMIEVPVGDIEADALVRDRVVLDAEAMDELKLSIAKTGLRLPIEIFERKPGQGGARYGLLSGYRRLKAVRDLRALTGAEVYDTIRAVVRSPEAMGGTFAAMVEENEIRASLSQYERGRIAVIAAQQGAFVNTEEAVAHLFPMASKAKRSKIRSFALIFEELGDVLTFPDMIREKDGLRLATALRDGAEAVLRDALAEEVPDTPADEAVMIDRALALVAAPQGDPARGGRPRKASKGRSVALETGITLQMAKDGQGWMIRLSGDRVDRILVEDAMRSLEDLLGPA